MAMEKVSKELEMGCGPAMPIEIAEIFFTHWRHSRVDAAVDMLSEDVLYDNVPFPDIRGREAVRAFHKDFGLGTRFKTEWQVTQIAATDNVILNERIDIFIHHNGARIVLPVMGLLVVEDGMIALWRDYFDPAEMDRQLAALPA
jgi:limonene-1,2-epoxide hydrolase